MTYYAHSGLSKQPADDWKLLAVHLREVPAKAKELAELAAPGDPTFAAAAFTAGLLHDLGKYRPGFQQ